MKITRDNLRQLTMEEISMMTEASMPELISTNIGGEFGLKNLKDEFVGIVPDEYLRPYLYKLTDRVDAIEQALGGKLSAEELPDVNLKPVSPEGIEVD